MPGLKLLKIKLSVPLRMPSIDSTRSPVSIRSFRVEITGRPAPTVVCSMAAAAAAADVIV
jgi:hypothetical protein